MEENKSLKNRDGARVIGGLILVAVGAALFARNMNYIDLPYWLFSWPMILILAGIYQGVKHNFSNNGWIITIAIGVFFLFNKIIPNLRLEPAFWPLVIVGIGVLFIIRPRKKNFFNDMNIFGKDNSRQDQPSIKPSSYTSAEKSDFLNIDSVFSGVDRAILSKNFQGGKINCVFGGAEIDFLQADINGNVLLKMDVVFGGAKLLIPSHWSVYSEIDGAFHSVDDKRKHNNGIAVDPNKVLILKGSCVFGGIEIKSY